MRRPRLAHFFYQLSEAQCEKQMKVFFSNFIYALFLMALWFVRNVVECQYLRIRFKQKNAKYKV